MINLSNLEVAQFGQAIGWMIVHSFWQLALAGLVLRALLFVLPQKLANLRYLLLVTGLLLATIWSVSTFFREFQAAQAMAGSQPAAVYSGSEAGEIPSSPAAADLNAGMPALPPAPAPADRNGLSGWINQWGAALGPYIPAVAYSWFFGVLLFSAYLVFGFLQLHRLQRKHTMAPEAAWMERFEQLKRRMGIRRKVVFSLSGRIAGPVTFHWFRPVVLAPVSIFTGLRPEQVEVLLLHELAHIRRYDYPVNVAQSLVEILFFYHPAVWWISGKIREEREHACDDLVMRMQHAPMLYAEALTQLQLFHHPLKMKLAMTAIGKKNSFSKRIFRLFGEYDQQPSLLKGSMIALLLMIALLAQAFFVPENLAGKEAVEQRLTAMEDEDSCAALLQAVKNKEIDKVKTVLKYTDPDCTYYEAGEPRSPLVAAARLGYLEIGKMLVEAKADIGFHADGDETPLMAAAGYGHLDFVKFLVGQGAMVNTKVSGDGTALLVAAAGGHVEVMRYLIEQKADIDAAVEGDGTPLIVAVKGDHLEAAKLLLENGADPYKAVPGDEYAMYHARMSGNRAMIALLKRYEDANSR